MRNAGSARIKGAEQQIEWSPAKGLNISLAATELDPVLNKDFCLDVDANGTPLPLSQCISADSIPSGTQLPLVPKFKGDATVRYSFSLGDDLAAHVQASYTYQSEVSSRLSPFENSLIGSVPAYGLLDVLGGIAKGNFTAEVFATNVLDKRAETNRFAECTIQIAGSVVCGDKPLAVITTPRTIGIRFGQRF